MSDKPEAAKLGWTIEETTYPYTSERVRLRQDRVQIAGKGEITYTYEERAPAVGIVPVTADGNLLLIWQYRYPIDTWCLEIPAGGTRDQPGTSLADVARIELREEVGATCGALEYVGCFYVKCASLDQRFHVFLAWDAEQTMEPAHETTEAIEVRIMPVKEAFALARSGQMQEAHSALALFLCERRLRERGHAT